MAHQLIKKTTIEPHTSHVYACPISPDGTLVATGSYDKTLCIINIATQKMVYSVKCGNYLYDVAWSPDGTRLIAMTNGGSVIEVTNNNAHSTVYKSDTVVNACAFSPNGILAVGGDDCAVTLLDPFKNYSVIQTFTGLSGYVWRVAFSPAGNILAVGCYGGYMYIYGLTNGKWAQVAYNKYHSERILSLCFSPSGRMLLVTCGDKTASIWNVPSNATWALSPHVTLEGHTNEVRGCAFLGDESHVITGSWDHSLRIWRTSDGLQTANCQCGGEANSLSYHAVSDNIIIGLRNGHVEIWQTDLFGPLPAHVCVRERLAEAKAEADEMKSLLDKTDSVLRQQMSREQELKRSIADLEAKLASEKKALAQLQTPEYIAQSRDLSELMERHNELLGIIHACTQTLDSLTDCLSVSGLEDLRGEAFNEWLCDIGMSKLQTALKDIDGISLTMLSVELVMEYGVSFSDAAALQLRGYIAHNKLSDDSAFAPPSETVLSWDEAQTANWIASLDASYACLASAGWHGAALCSLSPPRVVEAGKGALKVPNAVKFIGLLRAKRTETDGDKATWVSKWTGTSAIENQAI